MKKPNVQLKNLKFHEGNDGIGMNCDVWIDGVKCFHVHDDARGGCYDYYNYTHNNSDAEKVKSLIKNLEDYIETLPPKKYDYQGKQWTSKVDMDSFINDLAVEEEEKKAKKKRERLMKTAILIGNPSIKDCEYSYFNLKRNLSDIPKSELQDAIDIVQKKHCIGGIKILNTNLAELGVKV